MPKENTHLWFAQSLIAAPVPTVGLDPPRSEPLFFFLGSIIPDAFYYHPLSRARRMPRVLHGSDPEWKNTTPFWLVSQAKGSQSPRDKAFVLGYLSHLALDRVFHPVVHVLSGKRKGQASSYMTVARHRLVETALDRYINQTCFFHRIIHPRLGDHVHPLQSLIREIGLGNRDLRRALTVQRLVNRLVLERGTHTVLTFLDRAPVWDLSALRNLCYAQLDQELALAANGQNIGPEKSSQDKGLRAVRRINWHRLFARSKEDALAMFWACEAFWRGDVTEDALAKALPRRACD